MYFYNFYKNIAEFYIKPEKLYGNKDEFLPQYENLEKITNIEKLNIPEYQLLEKHMKNNFQQQNSEIKILPIRHYKFNSRSSKLLIANSNPLNYTSYEISHNKNSIRKTNTSTLEIFKFENTKIMLANRFCTGFIDILGNFNLSLSENYYENTENTIRYFCTNFTKYKRLIEKLYNSQYETISIFNKI